MPTEAFEQHRPSFSPDRSELERDSEKLSRYIALLEEALGNGFRVVGVTEIGSFAKGEAVPTSDIDTRVYVEGPNYLWQTDGSRYGDLQKETQERKFARFSQKNGDKPRIEYNWYEFNDPIARELCEALGCNVEFGLVDARYAAFELDTIDEEKEPVKEHALILQSNILFDPNGFLAKRRQLLTGTISPVMANFYRERYLDTLPFEIYEHIKPHSSDTYKAEKSGQIQWINRAVRCLRDAVATKTYLESGVFTFKKPDVLKFYQTYLPEYVAFIEQIYGWKCDPVTREKMVEEFLKDPSKFFPEFETLTQRLEEIVKKVNAVSL